MIFIPGSYRLTNDNLGTIVTALESILRSNPGVEDLADGETWL